MEKLDIKSLQNAVHSLRMSVNKLEELPNDDYVRDSVIQRFEYTYELCCKILRRFLEMISDNADEISRLSFSNLIRTANEHDLLLNDWTIWKNYRDARNITSHTYDKEKADKVALVAKEFIIEAEFLSSNLEKKLAEIQ